MTELYRRYRLWMPWTWLPIVAFVSVLLMAAGVFVLERKCKAAVGAVIGTRASREGWAPGPVARVREQRPIATVDVLSGARAVMAEDVEEAKVEEAEEARVGVRR